MSRSPGSDRDTRDRSCGDYAWQSANGLAGRAAEGQRIKSSGAFAFCRAAADFRAEPGTGTTRSRRPSRGVRGAGAGIQPVSGVRRRDPEHGFAESVEASGETEKLGQTGRIPCSREFVADEAGGSESECQSDRRGLLPGKSNYFLGNDSAKWRHGVPQFARVRYENIYPGINLVFYGNQGRLEYDFQVAPGADPAQAELEFKGAKQLELKNGALVIEGRGQQCATERSARVPGDCRAPAAGRRQLRSARRQPRGIRDRNL